MSWNLRNQILLPISIVFLLGITIATSVNVTNLFRAEKQKIANQVNQLFDTIEEKSFPLTDSVLRQVHSISSIHVIVDFGEGEMYATSLLAAENVKKMLESGDLYAIDSSSPVIETHFENTGYFAFRRELNSSRAQNIFAFYPKRQLTESINRAIWPQVITGVLTLLITVGLIVWVIKRVTQPIRQLQHRVEKIAEGNFETQVQTEPEFAKAQKRSDEIGELYRCIHQMASRLKLYEERIRNQEKLFTLDQMGGGIAHQMRNSITGCRLALDFHKEVCTVDHESLAVANRQLRHMEDFQKQFLAIGREKNTHMQSIDVGALIKRYMPLLQPVARHVAVELVSRIPEKTIMMEGNLNRLEQMLNNLLMNAIEAASANLTENNKQVCVSLEEDSDSGISIAIRDNGLGVYPEIENRLFEPLATTKADGVGLGLAIVKQTVEEHDGTIEWKRDFEMTEFILNFRCSVLPSNRS